jgi:chromosomal replication initiation ATPase DnaA
VSATSDQLLLDLAQRPALGAEDFLISRSNQAAADVIDRWPDWQHASLVVMAPARAGKTHLSNVWRLRSGAMRLDARALSEEDVAHAKGPLLVEDLHAGIASERALFHLLKPHVNNHNALHMDQSMAAAAAIVAEIDRAAMASHRKVTRALAGEILARQQAGG